MILYLWGYATIGMIAAMLYVYCADDAPDDCYAQAMAIILAWPCFLLFATICIPRAIKDRHKKKKEGEG